MEGSNIRNEDLVEAEKEVHFKLSSKELKWQEAHYILTNFDSKKHNHVTQKLVDPKTDEVFIIWQW
jgi:hypothetical protein